MIYSLFLMVLSIGTPARPDTSATLILRIEDVRSEEGNISIAFYTEENEFMSDDNFYKALRITPRSPVTEQEFTLPPGRYAVAVYHDVDDNEEMAKSWLGIPKEPVGLSQNAIKGMSRPTFTDAAFDLEGRKKISIDLRHF